MNPWMRIRRTVVASLLRWARSLTAWAEREAARLEQASDANLTLEPRGPPADWLARVQAAGAIMSSGGAPILPPPTTASNPVGAPEAPRRTPVGPRAAGREAPPLEATPKSEPTETEARAARPPLGGSVPVLRIRRSGFVPSQPRPAKTPEVAAATSPKPRPHHGPATPPKKPVATATTEDSASPTPRSPLRTPPSSSTARPGPTLEPSPPRTYTPLPTPPTPSRVALRPSEPRLRVRAATPARAAGEPTRDRPPETPRPGPRARAPVSPAPAAPAPSTSTSARPHFLPPAVPPPLSMATADAPTGRTPIGADTSPFVSGWLPLLPEADPGPNPAGRGLREARRARRREQEGLSWNG